NAQLPGASLAPTMTTLRGLSSAATLACAARNAVAGSETFPPQPSRSTGNGPPPRRRAATINAHCTRGRPERGYALKTAFKHYENWEGAMQKVFYGFVALAGLALAIFGIGPARAVDTIKIALIMCYSGQFADTAVQMDNAVKLFVKQHGDTVAGKKIEFIRK